MANCDPFWVGQSPLSVKPLLYTVFSFQILFGDCGFTQSPPQKISISRPRPPCISTKSSSRPRPPVTTMTTNTPPKVARPALVRMHIRATDGARKVLKLEITGVLDPRFSDSHSPNRASETDSWICCVTESELQSMGKIHAQKGEKRKGGFMHRNITKPGFFPNHRRRLLMQSR